MGRASEVDLLIAAVVAALVAVAVVWYKRAAAGAAGAARAVEVSSVEFSPAKAPYVTFVLAAPSAPAVFAGALATLKSFTAALGTTDDAAALQAALLKWGAFTPELVETPAGAVVAVTSNAVPAGAPAVATTLAGVGALALTPRPQQ